MSARISIANLRELANEDLLDLIEPDAMFAVLDAVECAHDLHAHVDLTDVAPLMKALARFDFGDGRAD